MATEPSSFWDTRMKWSEMRGSQRLAFLLKNVLNFAAFGFLFPSLWD